MTTITIKMKEINELKKQITDLAQNANVAMESAKASAAIAYQASVENVKANKNLEAKIDAYILSDTEWKDRAEPVIKLGENSLGASKAILWLTGLIIALGGSWQIIRTFFHPKI